MIWDLFGIWNTKFSGTPRHTHILPMLVDVDVHNRRIYDAIILIWSYLIKSEHTFFGTLLVFLSFRSLERHLDFYSVPMLRLMTWCDQDTNATLVSGHQRGHHRSWSRPCGETTMEVPSIISLLEIWWMYDVKSSFHFYACLQPTVLLYIWYYLQVIINHYYTVFYSDK